MRLNPIDDPMSALKPIARLGLGEPRRGFLDGYDLRCQVKNKKFKAVRGGGWHSGPYCTRVYRRLGLPPYWVDINVGFRCAVIGFL